MDKSIHVGLEPDPLATQLTLDEVKAAPGLYRLVRTGGPAVDITHYILTSSGGGGTGNQTVSVLLSFTGDSLPYAKRLVAVDWELNDGYWAFERVDNLTLTVILK